MPQSKPKPSEIALEPFLALLAPIMLPPTEAPSVGVEMERDEEAATEPLAALSVGVRTESAVAIEFE